MLAPTVSGPVSHFEFPAACSKLHLYSFMWMEFLVEGMLTYNLQFSSSSLDAYCIICLTSHDWNILMLHNNFLSVKIFLQSYLALLLMNMID